MKRSRAVDENILCLKNFPLVPMECARHRKSVSRDERPKLLRRREKCSPLATQSVKTQRLRNTVLAITVSSRRQLNSLTDPD
jgi:hypothetical protein